MPTREQKIVVVGAGKVGTALAVLLQKAGYVISGIASRTLSSAKSAAERLNPLPIYTEKVHEIVPESNIIILSTRDDAIGEACHEIAKKGGFKRGQIVLHVSGSVPSSVLSPARDDGCFIGSMHPLQSFADVDIAIKKLAGSYFCLEGDSEATKVAGELARALGGQVMNIRTEDKPVYHAAAVIASNFFVSIIDMSLRFYEAIGIDREGGLMALLPLIEGSLSNIRQLGPVKALTGPIARGDAGVVESHIEAIKRLVPEFLSPYTELVRLNVDVARRKGTLTKEAADRILALLED